MTLAVDISNYSGTINAAQVAMLKRIGVGKVIVQLVNPGELSHRQQIPVLLAAGMAVEAYVYVWMSDLAFITERIRWANAELWQFPAVKFLWLDCEDVSDGLTPKETRDAIQRARTEALLPCGIYTAGWWWQAHTEDWTGCRDLPLWDADYDGRLALDPVAYGGWTLPVMKQYQGDATIAGIPNVDLNWYEEEDVKTHRPTYPEIIALAADLKNFAYSVNDNGLADGFDTQVVENPPAGVTRQYLVSVKE